MFLATTALTEFWGEGEELLFLGPWCQRHDRRQDWEGRPHRLLPNPYEDRRRLALAYASAAELAEVLLPRLAEALNRSLGVERSTRYWRIVLGLWWPYFAQEVVDHHLHLSDAFEAYPDLRTLRLDAADFETPEDYPRFIERSLADRYNLQLYSHILSFLRPESPVGRLAPSAPAPARRGGILRGLLSRGLARSKGILVSDLYLDHKAELRLMLKTKGKAYPYYFRLPHSARRPDAAMRKALAGIRADDGLQRIAAEALPWALPVLYLEGHEDARRESLARAGKAPSAVATAVGWTNDAFRFIAADCAERGGKVIAMQHGGGYGLLKYAGSQDFERSVADRFYAWGWSALAKDDKVRDLGHPLLRKGDGRARGGDILLVMTSDTLHNMRLAHGPIGTQSLDYMRRQGVFLEALAPDLRSLIRARPYPGDFGWDQAARLKEAAPGLRFDDPGAALSTRLDQCRLAVFDHPLTGFLQALAADAPTIAYWSRAHWEPVREAEPFLEGLAKAGIVHEAPESAARQAAAVYGDPQSWWRKSETQRARTEFCRMFARAEESWLDSWSRELLKEQP